MTQDADEPSDDALIRAYVAGDASAFERLFRRHRKPLFTYLVHHVGSRGLAEDLFQEVFLRLIRGCAEYRPTGSFRSWLFAIAHNVMTDNRRRLALRAARGDGRKMESREREADEPWEEALALRTGHDDPVASSHANDLREHIESALLRIPAPQREVFLLRERGGLDLQRIAKVTGSNLATVKSRMRYALAGLRRLLSEELASLPEFFHE